MDLDGCLCCCDAKRQNQWAGHLFLDVVLGIALFLEVLVLRKLGHLQLRRSGPRFGVLKTTTRVARNQLGPKDLIRPKD